MLTDSKAILRRLNREGWVVTRIAGSHHICRHAGGGKIVIVPHPKKDLPLGTVKNIYRQAGWPRD